MAYLLKAKKNIEEQDLHEFKVKKEKYLERRKKKRVLKETAEEYDPSNFTEKLAPGILQKYADEKAHVRYAEYIGSFSVPGLDQVVRSEFVRRQLCYMQTDVLSKSVFLILSTAGIKVVDTKSQSLLMAHAIHRISYCTCLPEENLFCFLSREPRGPVNVQCCHVFTTPKEAQVEEINQILGDYFEAAQKAQKSAPVNFNTRIAEKLKEQKIIFDEVQMRAKNEKYKVLNAMTAYSSVILPGERLTKSEKESKSDLENQDDKILMKHPWFQPKTSREEALVYLLRQEIGGFLIRESQRVKNCFTLSLRVHKADHPSGVLNYIIEAAPSGVKLRGVDKEWPNLTTLVMHHSLYPENLPCRLKLPNASLEEETAKSEK